MTNYKQKDITNLTKTTFNRMQQAVIDNPKDGIPQITMYENQDIMMGGEFVTSIPTGRNLSISMVDPNLNIPYVDSNYVQTKETFKAIDLAEMVTALYVYLAMLEDKKAS